MDAREYYRSNTTNLAYMGDAVYEVFVRKRLLGKGIPNTNALQKAAVGYVRAKAQAAAVKEMFDSLTEDEQALVKRARNHRSATKPKNADPVEYKWATAFEALVGYLYLAEKTDRLEEVMNRAVLFLEERQTESTR